MRQIFLFIFTIIAFSFHPTFADSDPDLFIDGDGFSTNPSYPVEGKKMRMYVTLINSSSAEDMRGFVRAYDATEKKQIEVEQSFSVLKNNKASLFFDFTPSVKGVHEIAFRIVPWEDYKENQIHTDVWSAKIFVDSDADADGYGDQIDAYPQDATMWQAKIETATPLPSPSPSSNELPDDVFSLEKSRPPVVVLSQMNAFSIRRGEDFIINSGPSRGFLGENLFTKWEIINQQGEILLTKEAPELRFSVSWIGNYTIRATVTNESGISSVKEIAFSVRFSWRDFFMAIGATGLLGCMLWWFWSRRRFLQK